MPVLETIKVIREDHPSGYAVINLSDLSDDDQEFTADEKPEIKLDETGEKKKNSNKSNRK